MAFVDNQIAEILRSKIIQILRNALDRAAHHKGIGLSDAALISPYGYLGPNLLKCLDCLIHQLMPVRDE